MLYADILPYVLPHVPACPNAMAEQCIRLSAIELFRRANLWWNEFALTSVADQAGYSLGTPSGIAELAEAKKIDSVVLDGREVSPAPIGYVTESLDGGSSRDLAYTQDLRTVMFSPAPTASGLAIKVRAWLVPSSTSTQIPDAPATQHIETIAAGALARVLVLPQPWKDPGMAGVYLERFDRGVSRAANSAARGHSSFKGRVKAHFM
jgi:hypothetical protein